MTRDEAMDWLESEPDPEAYDFCIEYMGGHWIGYQWFGAAGDDGYPRTQGTFVECVQFVKDYVEKRRASTVGVAHE